MSDEDDKINALFGSESEEERPSAPSKAADALQRAGLESDEEDDQQQAPAHALASAPDDFKADDEDEQENPGEHRVKLDPEVWHIPLTTRPPHELKVVSFKSLLDIESQPFNADKFELESSESTDEMGRRRVRASELNRIRWRWTGSVDPATGALERESNARFVRWSDGSLQLHIGDDVLDVTEQEIGDQNLTLCVFHSSCKLLQAQAQINTRFVVKPHGLDSRLHRNLTTKLSPVKNRQSKVRLNAIIKDYEKEGVILAQQEDARLKLEKKQEKVMKKSSRNYPSFGALSRRSRGMGLTTEALEAQDSDYDDDEDDGRGAGRTSQYDEDEEEERERRLLAAKRETSGEMSRKRRLIDDDDDFDTRISDDDPEDFAPPAANKQSKKRFIIDDDESE